MVQSPSWEANWFAEIPRISRNPKVHYRTHKRPPPVSILGQPNTVHIPTSHLLEIHPNIIHPSTPRSPPWSSSLWFPQQDSIHPLSSLIRATCLAHRIVCLRNISINTLHKRDDDDDDNNINIYLLQLGCYPVAVVMASVHKIPVMCIVLNNNSVMRHGFFYKCTGPTTINSCLLNLTPHTE